MKLDNLNTISLIIPVFNEKENIAKLMEELIELNDKSRFYDRIIIVLNGSVDGTKEVFRDLPKRDYIITLDIAKNEGYGAGIKAGLVEVNEGYVVINHADLQIPSTFLFEFVSKSDLEKTTFVKASRKNRTLTDVIFTKLMSLFVFLVFQKKMSDINAQPTFFHSSILDNISKLPNDFTIDFMIYLSAKRNCQRILRPVVFVQKRYGGKSSWNRGFISKISLSTKYITSLIVYRLGALK
jgi:polyisoprenyl-phosphate glycosyltransferase